MRMVVVYMRRHGVSGSRREPSAEAKTSSILVPQRVQGQLRSHRCIQLYVNDLHTLFHVYDSMKKFKLKI